MKNRKHISSFLVSLFLFFAGIVHSQISLKIKDRPVREVLKEIERKSEYKFFYNAGLTVIEEKTTLEVTNEPIDQILKKLFENKNIIWEEKDKNLIVLMVKTEIPQAVKQNDVAKTISGVILDEFNDPVIGANIIEKGTTNGTIADLEGHFTLKVQSGSILQISYIGYLAREIKIGQNDIYRVVLAEDLQKLDEVVVIGYGVQKKVNLTGAVSVISGDDMNRRPVTNASSMLQAQVPGLRVVNGSGQSGNNKLTLRIRGQGTYSNAGSDPLVLINGVPGDLSMLDPNSIESVSVLKDAASAAVYGARAANGVVLITTKTGNERKITVNYSGNFAIYSPTRMLDVVTNSAEYMTLWNEAKTNSGISDGLYPEEEIEKYRNAAKGDPNYPNYDWLGEHIKSSFAHTHNLNITGGTDKVSYNIGMNYADEDGTMDGHGFKKYNFTADLSTQMTSWLRMGTYVSLMRSDRHRPYEGGVDGSFTSIFAQAPTYAPRRSDGLWTSKAYTWESNNKNVIALIGNDSFLRNTNYDVNAQAWFTADILKGLTWHTKGAVRLHLDKEKEWRPLVKLYNFHTGEYMNDLDVGEKGLNVNNYTNFYTYLYSYLKYDVSTVDKNHNFSLQFGYSQETNDYDYLKGYRYEFAYPLQELNAGSIDLQEASGDLEQWSLMGIFGRFNYNYKERYLFEANFRYDGSSRLNPDNRWGIFPSFSAGWRITEERFIKNIQPVWLDNLKIRGSWGQLGNQNIGVYPYQAVMVNDGDYSFDNSTISTGYAQKKYANRNIKWETTTVTDIGVEMTLFDGLNLTLDWYQKKTTDIIRSAQITGTLGLTAPIVNEGEMVNKGIELSIQYINSIKGGFFRGLTYNGSFYIDRFRNKVTKFGAEQISGNNLIREGLPYNSFYMLDCIGIFKDDADVLNSPRQFNDNTLPGDLKFRDVNNDGVIDNDDRIVVNGRFPKFEYAINLSANWKGFDLSVLMQGVEGKSHYVTGWGLVPYNQGSSPTKDYIKNRWTEENPDNATYPRLYHANMGGTKNTRVNSYFLKEASFFRLKNLTIGYTLPVSITRNVFIDRVRVFFSGDNLALISNYPELDPERDGDGRFVAYPQNRICSFGINVQF